MNKQLLTLGLVLSLATPACAGLGVQTSPTVANEIFQEQGLGELWGEGPDEALDTATSVEHRDERELTDLWVEADLNSDWSGDGAKEAPRAAAMLKNPTLAVTW